jgi:putative ABC transport system permease protein
LTNFLSSLLFNIKATDATTFLLVGLILAVVALVASFVPAYRATTVDPVNALRQE